MLRPPDAIPGMMPPQGMPAGAPPPMMPGPMQMQPPPVAMPAGPTHEVTIVIKRQYGCAVVENIPPEEFGVSRRTRSVLLKDCDYCYHEVKKSQAQLIAMGFDEEQVKKLPSGESDGNEEGLARDTVEDSSSEGLDYINEANRQIRVTEHYVMLDYEGDGKAKRYRITTAGGSDQILKRDGKLDITPENFVRFAAMTPIIVTHRHYGRSIADLVSDIQKIKTALLRGLLDNVYLSNNQRIEISESHATDKTLDDLLANRPGGVVRTKQPGGLIPIPNTSIGEFAYPMMEYMDATREWRTGVTRQGQGIDADALQNQSATAVSKVYNAAQARMRLIARIMAETGIKDLFWLLHATIRQNETKAQTVRLRNKWVEINPREWKQRSDLTVNVGLGIGSKEQEMMFLMALLNIQKEAVAAPQLKLVKPDNIYSTLKQVVTKGGLKSVEPYFTDPASREEEPVPPSPEEQEAKAKMELESAKAQAQGQLDQAKAQADGQLEQQKAAAQLQMDRERGQMELQLQREKMTLELQLKRETVEAELILKREQLAAELQLKRELAHEEMKIKAKVAGASGGSTSDVHVGGDPG